MSSGRASARESRFVTSFLLGRRRLVILDGGAVVVVRRERRRVCLEVRLVRLVGGLGGLLCLGGREREEEEGGWVGLRVRFVGGRGAWGC